MKLITIILLATSAIATNLRNTTFVNFNDIDKMGTNKYDLSNDTNKYPSTYSSTGIKIKCKSGFGKSCVCPGGCMLKPTNNSNFCTIKHCWSWNLDLTRCEGTGPNWTPAIVLQGIPFTGVFGAGLGNMGRWDLFAIGSGFWGGGFVIAILIGIITGSQAEDGGTITSCYGCVLTCAILAYWVWGLVVIANKSILGGNGCPFGPDT